MIKINLEHCTYEYHSKINNQYKAIKGLQYNKEIIIFGS